MSGLYFLGDYTPCTETNFGGTPSVISLADTGGSVVIASPQYPNNYYDSSACHWSFETSDPSSTFVIEIEILEVDVRIRMHIFQF